VTYYSPGSGETGGAASCAVTLETAVGGLVLSAPAFLPQGAPVKIDIAEEADGALQALDSWRIDWGDGTSSEGTGPDLPEKVYDAPGLKTIRMTLRMADGSFTALLVVQVGTERPVTVEELIAGTGAVEIVFSRAVQMGAVTLEPGQTAPDVTLTGPDGTPVAGSFRFADGGRRLIFRPDAGKLAPGSYTLQLRSGPDAFADTLKCPLDGDEDGVPGGSFTVRFDIAREEAALPRSIPLFAEHAGGAHQLSLQVALPAGTWAEVAPGADLPEGAALDARQEPEGLILRIESPQALQEGRLELARLALRMADVQADTPQRIAVTPLPEAGPAPAETGATEPAPEAEAKTADLVLTHAAASVAGALALSGREGRGWRQGFVEGEARRAGAAANKDRHAGYRLPKL
jgi:hypothetical protein